MEANFLNAVFFPLIEALKVYIANIAIAFVVLVFVILVDYITGIIKAWITRTLSSQVGIKGLLKKLGYFGLIAVAMVVDWLINNGLTMAGVMIPIETFVGAVTIIILIVNECLSIIENLEESGITKIPFLTAIVKRIKKGVEDKVEQTLGEPDDTTTE